MNLLRLLDKVLISIGRKLYVILPCVAVAAIALLYAVTNSDKHLHIFVVSICITVVCYCLFQCASKVRPKKFSFEKLLSDRGADIVQKNSNTLQIRKMGAIFAEIQLNQSGIVSSIKSQNHDGSFTTKVAEIAPHQPFFKAVEIAQQKLYFTPSMAFYIASLTLSLGRKSVQKEQMKKEVGIYISGVDYLYS